MLILKITRRVRRPLERGLASIRSSPVCRLRVAFLSFFCLDFSPFNSSTTLRWNFSLLRPLLIHIHQNRPSILLCGDFRIGVHRFAKELDQESRISSHTHYLQHTHTRHNRIFVVAIETSAQGAANSSFADANCCSCIAFTIQSIIQMPQQGQNLETSSASVFLPTVCQPAFVNNSAA